MCSACMRAIPPKDNSRVSPPAPVERDNGLAGALKAQSESIDALVDMVETNWLAQMAESNQAEDIELAEPALSDEDASDGWGASVLNGVVLVIVALFVAALVVVFRDRFKSVPPVVAPVNGSVREYIS